MKLSDSVLRVLNEQTRADHIAVLNGVFEFLKKIEDAPRACIYDADSHSFRASWEDIHPTEAKWRCTQSRKLAIVEIDDE